MIVAIRKKICTSPSSMVAPESPRGFEKSDWPTPIQTSYFIGPYNMHCLLFSGIGALLCHHPYCFSSQSQILFGIGAGRLPITAVARWKYLRLCWREGLGGWRRYYVVLSNFWNTRIVRDYYQDITTLLKFFFFHKDLFIYFFNLLNLYPVTRCSLLRYSV